MCIYIYSYEYLCIYIHIYIYYIYLWIASLKSMIHPLLGKLLMKSLIYNNKYNKTKSISTITLMFGISSWHPMWSWSFSLSTHLGKDGSAVNLPSREGTLSLFLSHWKARSCLAHALLPCLFGRGLTSRVLLQRRSPSAHLLLPLQPVEHELWAERQVWRRLCEQQRGSSEGPYHGWSIRRVGVTARGLRVCQREFKTTAEISPQLQRGRTALNLGSN